MQALFAVEAMSLVVKPPAQPKHVLSPVKLAKRPLAQNLQSLNPSPAYFPNGQSVQNAAPGASENLPF
jgi:hypothetical protein